MFGAEKLEEAGQRNLEDEKEDLEKENETKGRPEKKGGGTPKRRRNRERLQHSLGPVELACLLARLPVHSAAASSAGRVRERERDGEREETRRGEGAATRRSEGHPRTARFTREHTGLGSPSTAMHGGADALRAGHSWWSHDTRFKLRVREVPAAAAAAS